MRRLLAVTALALVAAAPAAASDDPAQLASAVERDIVHVEPRAADRVSVAEAGSLRLRITQRALGRIKILVAPEAAARRNGGVSQLSQAVAAQMELRGALIVLAGNEAFVVTSYDSDEALAAVQKALGGGNGRRIADDLEQAIDGVARADPGEGGGLGSPGGGGDLGANDFLDDIGDTFRTAAFAFVAVIALVFLIPLLVWGIRARRRRADSEEGFAIDRERARQDLIDVGDMLRELDAVDTTAPGVDPTGRDALVKALDLYDRADRELAKAGTRRRFDQARTTLNSARSQAMIARRRLLGEPSQAANSAGGSGFVSP